MKKVLSEILKELGNPSLQSETAFLSYLIAIGHGVLGAALAHMAVAFGMNSLSAMIVVPLAYFFIKELFWDLRRNGSFRDSMIDTAMILFGTLNWISFWEIWLLILGFAATVISQSRRVDLP